jgi:hypothetical protein
MGYSRYVVISSIVIIYLFFTCLMAKFTWAGIRELLHYDWNPMGGGDFLALE